MKRPLEHVHWHTRLEHDRPYQTVKANGNNIDVGFMAGKGKHGYMLTITRADARLLARRINQCLDGTAKK